MNSDFFAISVLCACIVNSMSKIQSRHKAEACYQEYSCTPTVMYNHILSCHCYTAYTTSYRPWIFVTLLPESHSSCRVTSARLFLINHALIILFVHCKQINRKNYINLINLHALLCLIPQLRTYKAKVIIISFVTQ